MSQDLSSLKLSATPFEGLFVIERKIHLDERGTFEKLFSRQGFGNISLDFEIEDVNMSETLEPGTVRGLHFQDKPLTEQKIVTCVQGSIFDLVIDLRKHSSSYLRSFGIELSFASNRSIFVPQGFAHGFQALEKSTKVLYFVDRKYSITHQRGVNPLSPEISALWPLEAINISTQDQDWPNLENCATDFE